MLATFKVYFIYLIILINTVSVLSAQSPELTSIIQNYNNKDFRGASNSNFQITQDLFGYIYSGNFENSLKFNGKNWEVLESTNTLVTSLYFSDDDQLLLYGGKDDFGYYVTTVFGTLERNSLSTLFGLNDIGFVWSFTGSIKNGLYVRTSTGLYKLKKNKLKKTAERFSNFFDIDDKSFFISNGYLKIYSKKDSSLISGSEIIPNDIVLISGTSDSLHFINSSAATFFLKDSLVNFSNVSTTLQGNTIHIGKNFNSKLMAFGYVNNGLKLIGTDTISYSLKNGLKGSFVKDIYLDNHHNIWVAMQEGISMIGYYSPNENVNRLFEQETTSSLVHNKELYISSTTGVIHFDELDHYNEVIFDVVLSLSQTKKIVYASGRKGLYLIKNGQLSFISDPLLSITSVLNDSTLFTGSGQGLSLYTISNSSKIEKVQQAELPKLTYTDAIQKNNEIWVGTKSSGLYRWNLESNKTQHYTKPNNFKDDFYLRPIVINNTIYCFAPDGLYYYNKSQDRFIESFPYHNHIQYVFQDEENRFLISSKNKFGDMELDIVEVTDDDYQIVSKELNGFYHSSVNHINKDDEGNYWFATPEGLFKYDIEKAKSFDYEVAYNTLVSKVTTNDSLIFGGYYAIPNGDYPKMVLDQPDTYKPNLDYENNGLKFEFQAPYFTQNEKIQFSYYLEGNESDWSPWNKERTKEYNNLNPGTYTFHVKSKNVFDVEGRTAHYTFTIFPPWYMTSWAYAFFAVLATGFIWLIVLTYSFRVRRQRKNLKLVVADRTFEVLSQKKEIEKQNNKLQEQNKEITVQRDAINKKNHELEMSQDEILSINEQLKRLNQSLEKKVEERTYKIKETVNELRKTVSELDTFIYRASHDLKGPISRIHGLTSLAKLESTSQQDLKYYELINQVAKDMNKLLAKLTQVHEVINREAVVEPIDLPSIIAEVMDTNSFIDNEKSTQYSFSLEAVLQVNSDPFLVSIIFSNIIENALTFKKPNQKNHRLSIGTKEDDDNYYLTFEDNGIGIKDEHIANIFDMFYRGSDQSKGNGLGLYLSKMAIEKARGKIEVKSEFDKYTIFVITLPK